MDMIKCVYCKEDVQADALVCSHCGSRLQYDRRERTMAETMHKINNSIIEINTGPVSAHTAWCYGRYGSSKVLLNQCLEESREDAAVAAMAEALHKELIITFHDIVWGGGNIDPEKFETEVRERFSRPKRDMS